MSAQLEATPQEIIKYLVNVLRIKQKIIKIIYKIIIICIFAALKFQIMTRKKKTDTPKKSRKNYTLDTKDKAKQMYLRGLFLPEISKILEIPIRTLENWQTAEKWNAYKDTPEEITKRAYNMHRSGKSAKEIAKELGVSTRTVFRYTKKYEEYAKKQS